jgi:hypothetical protein
LPRAVVAASAEVRPAVRVAALSHSFIAAIVDTLFTLATADKFVAATTTADAGSSRDPKPIFKDHYCSPSLPNMMGHHLQLSISACLLSDFLLPAYLRSLEYREARATAKSTKTANRINTFIYYMPYYASPIYTWSLYTIIYPSLRSASGRVCFRRPL